LWKFNNSLVADSDFLSGCIDSSVRDQWDFFLLSLKSDVSDFSKKKRPFLNCKHVYLTNRLIACKQHLVEGDINIASEISSLESQLKVLLLKKLVDSNIRNHVQWLEEGGKPTRYYFKLERERFERNFISSIFDHSVNCLISFQFTKRVPELN